MKKNTMSEEDKEYWDKLCKFVEKKIFQYDDDQHLQKDAVLRLRGIRNGKTYANNKIKNNGNYSYKTVYKTFEYFEKKIVSAIRNKEFDSEGMKMAYVSAIVRNNLNKTVEIMKKVEKAHKESEDIDVSIVTHKSAEYKNKKQKKNLSKYEDMW